MFNWNNYPCNIMNIIGKNDIGVAFINVGVSDIN